jgi:5-methyltetrahydrofolate--homocysteine methyltransferase
MKNVVQAVVSSGLGMPVIVGGAPLTQDFADRIGAQDFAPDAASALDLIRRLITC